MSQFRLDSSLYSAMPQGELLVRDESQVSASTFGEGNGGSLQVIADNIELIGTSADGQSPSGLFARTEGIGDAGDLTIYTSRLLVRDGALVDAGTTFGEGNGGSLQVSADNIELIGTSADGQFRSGLYTFTFSGTGDAGNLIIETSQLLIRDGAVVSAGTFGEGNGGSLQVSADNIELIRTSANRQIPSDSFTSTFFASGLFTSTLGAGDAGNLTIHTSRLLVVDGARVDAGTFSEGNGGSLQVTADNVELIGTSMDGQFPSGLFARTEEIGDAGDLTIYTSRLLVRDGALVDTGTTFGEGNGGSLQVTADNIELIGTSADGQFRSGLYTFTFSGTGDAGNLIIETSQLLVRDGAGIFSQSFGQGNASNIRITVRGTLEANNGRITTSSEQSSGGSITITADQIRLYGNSDITTNVNQGGGGAGNINLKADSILAFDDSDILAFARDGQGGDITLNTPAFFGDNYDSTSPNSDPATLDNNNRVDVNATGAVSGAITLPDVSFIQNSLTELPETQINTDTLLANSCIVRRNQQAQGSFIITGSGGLPQRPGDAQISTFSTVDLETLPTNSTPSTTTPRRSWQKGDPIVEPQGFYRLPNGKLVLSRECS